MGVSGLPWQIELLPDGSTRVFGLEPGNTTLGQAVSRLGDDMELAVMAAEGERGSLEVYYGHYRAGLLTAKLVLAAEMDDATLKSMRDNAADVELLKSGTRKYIVSPQDRDRAFAAVIRSIAFIPLTKLDDGMIVSRFGKPAEMITMDDQTRHYLYPDKGLDIILGEEGRDVLQYVEPAAFKRLREPLGG